MLDLVDDSFEEGRAGLEKEWVAFVVSLVFDDVQVLVNDGVFQKHREISQEVELSLNIFLFFNFFVFKLVVLVDLFVRLLLIFIVDKFSNITNRRILILAILLILSVLGILLLLFL